jgi:hypothetical protein
VSITVLHSSPARQSLALPIPEEVSGAVDGIAPFLLEKRFKEQGAKYEKGPD